MANKGQISTMADSVKIQAEFDAINVKAKELNTTLGLLVTKAVEMNTNLGNIKGLKDVAKETDNLNKAEKERKTTIDEVTKLEQKLKDLNTEQAVNTARLKDEIQKKNKEIKDGIKAEGAAIDSLIKMQQQVSALAKEYSKMSEVERNSAKGIELGKKILELNTNINTTKKSIGDFTSNVAHYAEGFEEAMNKTGLGNTIIGKALVLWQGFKAAVDAEIITQKTLAAAKNTSLVTQTAKIKADEAEIIEETGLVHIMQTETAVLIENTAVTEVSSAATKEAAVSTGILNGAFKLLVANPWVAILSVAAVVFMTLKEAVERNAAIVGIFTRALEPLQKVMGAIFGVVGDVAKIILEAFIPAMNEQQKVLADAAQAEKNLINLKIQEKREMEEINNLMSLANNRMIDSKTRYEAITKAIELQVAMSHKMATEQDKILQGQIVKFEDYYNLRGQMVNSDMTLTTEANKKMSKEDKEKYSEVLNQLMDYDQKESEIRRGSARRIGQILKADVAAHKEAQDLKTALMADGLDKDLQMIVNNYKAQIEAKHIADSETKKSLEENAKIEIEITTKKNNQIISANIKLNNEIKDAEKDLKKFKKNIVFENDASKAKRKEKEENIKLLKETLKENLTEHGKNSLAIEKVNNDFNKNQQESNKTASELDNLIIANGQKKIEDTKKQYRDEALKAIDEFNKVVEEKTETAREKDLNKLNEVYINRIENAKINGEDILKIQEEYIKAKTAINAKHDLEDQKKLDEASKKILEYQKKLHEEIKKELEVEGKSVELIDKANYENEYQILVESYSKGILKKDEFERKKLELTEKYSEKQLNDAMLSAMELLTMTEQGSAEYITLANKIAELEIEAHKRKNKAIEDGSTKTTKKLIDNIKKYSGEAISLLNAVGNLLSVSSTNKLTALDDESKKDSAAKEKELSKANLTAAQKDAINAKYDKKGKEREAERRKIELEKAEFAKKVSIMNIILKTAQAVIGYLGEQNYPLAILAGVTGAIELATAVATQVPKYDKGLPFANKDHIGEVAERNPEVWVHDNIARLITEPSYIPIKRGDKIIPNHELMSYKNINSFENNRFSINMYKELIQSNNNVVNAINRIPKANLSVNITKEGIYEINNSSNRVAKYLSNRYNYHG